MFYRIQNDYKSLLTSLIDIKPYLPIKRVKKQKIDLKTIPIKKKTTKKACDSKKFEKEFETIRELRLNLEKVKY